MQNDTRRIRNRIHHELVRGVLIQINCSTSVMSPRGKSLENKIPHKSPVNQRAKKYVINDSDSDFEVEPKKGKKSKYPHACNIDTSTSKGSTIENYFTYRPALGPTSC